MAWRLLHPQWLWILALIVPTVWVGLAWMGGMSRPRRWGAVLLRATLIALLAAMLAGVSRVRVTDTLAVVAVVDVSESVRRFVPTHPGDTTGPDGAAPTLQAVREFLARAGALRRTDDLLGIVVFDGRPIVIATPSHANVADRSLDVRGADGTNIADAVALAAALIPPDAAGRLVLISDGNQTSGDALSAARQLARAGAGGVRRNLPVDVVPLDYDARHEVVVESVDAPPRAAAEAPVNIRVVLLSTGEASGTLRLIDNGTPVDINGPQSGTGRRVVLRAGRTVEVLEVPLGAERIHRFGAVFEPDTVEGPGGARRLAGDTLTDNNRAETFTITPGRGRVLYVDGVGDGREDGPGATLPRTLRAAGIDVTQIGPGAMPADLLSLQDYDLVVLENVPGDAVSHGAQTALAAHVRDLGGGLIMIGGPDSFGAGGWRGTPIEPLLPLRLDLPDKLVVPETAIVFVIDNSGSMGRSVAGSMRSQQEIADEAVAVAIRSLDARDLVGVITFNSQTDTVVPLAPNTDPGAAAERARSIGAGGGTEMLPALEEAGRALSRVDAKVRHIIVLSDGRSQQETDLAPKAAQLAADGIKVSTIAIGDAAALESMRQIAAQGKGVYYQVVDPNILPRVFLRAVRVVRTPLIREVPFVPVLGPGGSTLTAGLPSPIPPLGGLSLTQARAEPTITLGLTTPEGEPVLAHWSVELGQVAAFTSDTAKWAGAWLEWPGYRQFWTQAVRLMSRPSVRPGFTARVEVNGDELTLRMEASDDNGRPMDFLTVPATVYGPDGEAVEVRMGQTQPDVYEGHTTGPKVGSYVAVIKPSQGAKRLTPVIAGASITSGVETRRLSSNPALLLEIAKQTGGRVLNLASPESADLFDRQGVRPQEALLPVWRSLLVWALVVFLLDAAMRRVAWDRWVSKEYGVELRAAVAESVADRGADAGRTLSGLRGRQADQAEPAAPARAFTEEDALSLAQAAADRRRAARLASIHALRRAESSGDGAPPPPPSPQAPPSISHPGQTAPDLSAAKRRAGQRFEGRDDDS